MREICQHGSEGGGPEPNRVSLPLSGRWASPVLHGTRAGIPARSPPASAGGFNGSDTFLYATLGIMPMLPATLIHTTACVAAGLAAAVSAWGVFLVRGSTAVPAAFWSVAACLALAVEMGARAAGGLADPATGAAARLAVVSLSLCPAMSLLGAKRPQHGVWQLIVATLAVVLAMPAATALLMRPGSLPDLHLLERCFMPLLVLVGWMNFAGTRRAAPSVASPLPSCSCCGAFCPAWRWMGRWMGR